MFRRVATARAPWDHGTSRSDAANGLHQAYGVVPRRIRRRPAPQRSPLPRLRSFGCGLRLLLAVPLRVAVAVGGAEFAEDVAARVERYNVVGCPASGVGGWECGVYVLSAEPAEGVLAAEACCFASVGPAVAAVAGVVHRLVDLGDEPDEEYDDDGENERTFERHGCSSRGRAGWCGDGLDPRRLAHRMRTSYVVVIRCAMTRAGYPVRL
jgi:hypothetical protein